MAKMCRIHGQAGIRPFVVPWGLVSLLLVASVADSPLAIAAEGDVSKLGLVDVRLPVEATEGVPVAAVYVAGHGPRPGVVGPQVIMALWKNGRAIWSADRMEGGPPYFAAQIPPATVNSLLSQLADQGIFEDTVRDDICYGPDSTFTTLAICDGDKRLSMQSWHELFERNANAVVLSSGVSGLNGRNRKELLSREPEEYQRFRSVWNTVRSGLAAAIPKEGVPLEKCSFTLHRQPPVTAFQKESRANDDSRKVLQ